MGSGSLLLTVGKHLDSDVKISTTMARKKYGHLQQPYEPTTAWCTTREDDYEKCRHFSYDWPEDPERPGEGVQFDAVVMNPPYSAKNWNRQVLK